MSWFDIFAIFYVIFLIGFVTDTCRDKSEKRPKKGEKNND